MSRKGNPYDNARTESFMKTLKYEEVYRQEYCDLPDALRSLRRFIEKVYNEKRLHSALGYLPPSEFEANLVVSNNCKEAIRSLRERRNRRSPLIVSMSFRLVIPRRVAFLQSSPPLRQPAFILQHRPAVGK
jgi:hypothetical protein